MSAAALDRVARQDGGRILAALAARFRDLDLAEDAFSEACTKAAERWPRDGVPAAPAAWLYRVAERRALDSIRRRRTRQRYTPELPDAERNAEDNMTDDAILIPDERLRLIFVCCHPAVAPEARAALTLRLVCGLSTAEIARAFLLSEPTLAQRLVRAKRKMAEAAISFEVPGPDAWPERLDAVLITLEIAYSKAHEDAAGGGPHAGFSSEILDLTATLVELMPGQADVLAFAALVRYAEARRPARLDEAGVMVPLAEQDPAFWRRPLIEEADLHLRRACSCNPTSARVLQAALHGIWCGRRSLTEPAPWPEVLALYDALLTRRDDPVVRLNRAVALAETGRLAAALAAVDGLAEERLGSLPAYHAVRADLLRRAGRFDEARAAYEATLTFAPGPAERLWIEQRRNSLPARP